ncbi:hypothetical protein [Micrococcus sp. IITD107]|uniref:hypothetical protein n=1 Tax=Micrococcus sp. IITD107 TaxID=3342790 RepID=UPI0035B923BB
MDLAALIIFALVVAALAVAVAVFTGHSWWSERRAWRRVTARRVVVNLVNGEAVDGLLVARDGPLLTIRDAALMGASDEPVPIDGELLLHLGQIDYMQFPSS